MNILASLHQAAEQLSTTKTAAAGGTGGMLAIAAAVVDPGSVEMWLRIATLVAGLITALGSGGLVFLKYYDRWRARKTKPA